MKPFNYDVYRYYGTYKEPFKNYIFRPNGLKYLSCFRKCSSQKNTLLKMIYRFKLKMLQKKTLIQIPHNTSIGEGFYIGHNGSVIINPDVVIGKNCNIATGVTIGQENRGERKGAPMIGNEVWIGANAVIVGKINIGDNVLIAPLSFVNFDVPSNSIVIGNPARIIRTQEATKEYINNKI